VPAAAAASAVCHTNNACLQYSCAWSLAEMLWLSVDCSRPQSIIVDLAAALHHDSAYMDLAWFPVACAFVGASIRVVSSDF
jgi:hypothetical protein